MIYIQELLERMHKHLPIDKICTNCSMNKYYAKGVQNEKKVLLEIDGSKDDDSHAIFTVKSGQVEDNTKNKGKRE